MAQTPPGQGRGLRVPQQQPTRPQDMGFPFRNDSPQTSTEALGSPPAPPAPMRWKGHSTEPPGKTLDTEMYIWCWIAPPKPLG